MDLIDTKEVREAAQFLRSKVSALPQTALVLGSGLGSFAQNIENATVIPYEDVPHMCNPRLTKHKGNFIFGQLDGKQVLCLQGRLHLYEGFTAQEVAFPVYVLGELGVKNFIITNAAGYINPAFNTGDIMLITDHINMLGRNPSAGMHAGQGNNIFCDMSDPYSEDLRKLALSCAEKCKINLQQGVYYATLGPCFETKAEIRAFAKLGADAVGMSTVLEVIAAVACGIDVLGLSLQTNAAAGVQVGHKLTGAEVFEEAAKAAEKIQTLVTAILKQL